MRKVVLPQAFRLVLPPLTNELILLVKDSSLVYIIGVASNQYELTKFGRELSNTNANVTPLVVAGFCYLLITLPLTVSGTPDGAIGGEVTMTVTPDAGDLLQIVGLHKSFGDNHVLRGIDFTVAAGEVVCIIGPSGSGKSTLLRCINLLEQPDAGKVLVAGDDVTDRDCDIDAARRGIGMVFQQFNLFPHLTALENITVAPDRRARAAGGGRRGSRKRDLSGSAWPTRWTHIPAKLSGGQQQRVAIARALAMDPQLMLFDEPTSALDPELVGDVLTVMRRPRRGRHDDGRRHPRDGLRPGGGRPGRLHGRRRHRRAGHARRGDRQPAGGPDPRPSSAGCSIPPTYSRPDPRYSQPLRLKPR